MKAAQAQGLAVSRIDQTANSVTIVCTAPDGRTTTVVYYPISAATGVAAVPQPSTPPPSVSAPGAATVVYASTPYYFPYGYPSCDYYPWWGWPPVTIGLGWGWGWGHYGGGYRGWGGYHGGGFHGGGFHGRR